MVRKLFVLLALTSSLAIAGCNTIDGLGEDAESVGEAAEDCADGKNSTKC